MRSSQRRLVLAATVFAGLLAVTVAASSAAIPIPRWAGYAVGNHQVLVGFDLRGEGCPGPDCFDHHAHVVGFDAVGYLYPSCPQLIAGGTELAKSVAVGRNGSFEGSGRGDYAGEQISIGGRFLDEGRRARGWFIVDNGGCPTERTRWTAKKEL
jgi:hypothetical protein